MEPYCKWHDKPVADITEIESENCMESNGNCNECYAFYDENKEKEEHYPLDIMEALHFVLGINMMESKNDIRKMYSTTEILNAVAEYNGLISYAETIIRWVKGIYGIDLEEVDE